MNSSAVLTQTIHLYGRQPRLLAEHLNRLAEGYRRLYRKEISWDEQVVAERIRKRLDEERYPKDRSVGVDLNLDSRGLLTLHPREECLYRGYVLRALRPDAVTIPFEVPFEGLPTRAAEETWRLAGTMAEQRGVRGVVRLDRAGVLREADGAMLFAVIGRTIYTSSEPTCVEGSLAVKAIRRAGYSLHVEPLTREDLTRIEEIFYADYRGITALNSCDGRLLMSTIAERVSLQLEAIVGKK